ncbi:MAG TPA: hydroxymethylglutaryl-CoA reductase [Acidobacteriaceae bacterium]|jgi:hydroxymethylglutaryl-CoA reductase (NADPH)|nr:hydroxymethylglutaryl-CoA reductase [Acidobacteriaceae bacterium]
MAATQQEAQKHIEDLAAGLSAEEIARRLSPKHHSAPPRIPGATQTEPAVVEKRWSLVPQASARRDAVADEATLGQHALFEHSIENFIGTVKIPVGLAGPLRVNGIAAQGDYYVPLATTEAALVASYHRGAAVVTLAGGCTTLILNEGVGRSPAFAFASLLEAGTFAQWCLANVEGIRVAADGTSHHGRFRDLRITVEGNHVYLLIEFTTGDAAGQNMVTIATAAICNFIIATCPIKPAYYFVEGNMSGDKKASAQSFQGVRGKKVTAEVRLPREIVERHLHTTPEQMINYWRVSALGGVLSGTIGVQGHYANGLTALFIACGQDAACVSEAAVGITRFEVTADGGLYGAVTLPNLIVGTVGGGTGLPSQRACLDILGLAGTGHARAFAEVCAALALAGELSIIGALSAGHFARAHERLARGKKSGPDGEESRNPQ